VSDPLCRPAGGVAVLKRAIAMLLFKTLVLSQPAAAGKMRQLR